MSLKKSRLEWIDVAKGIASLFVVIGHVVSSYHEAGLYLENADIFNFLYHFAYSFHMPLFMMISGYLCVLSTQRNISKKKNILLKLISYGIPYITFSFLWVVMKLAFSQFTNSDLTLMNFLWIPVYPISFMWFIYALMLMQITQVIIGTVRGKGKAIHLMLAVAAFLLKPALAEVFASIHLANTIINDILAFYIYYLIGVYLLEAVLRRVEKIGNVTIMLVSGLIMVAGNILSYIGLLEITEIFRFLMACVGSLFFILFSKLWRKSRLLSYLGRGSLVIYVLQGFVIAAMRILLTKLNLNTPHGLCPMTICMIAVPVVTMLVYECSKRIFHMDFFFYPGRYLR